MLNGFKAVIFDMDGLLVDSEVVWMQCDKDILTARGKTWDDDFQASIIGLRVEQYLEQMIGFYKLTDSPADLRRQVVEHMLEIIPDQVVEQPGATDLIRFLADKGVPCSIASSSPMNIINRIVTSQGWDEYLKIHTSGEEVEHGKPHPDVYLLAAQRMGMKPEDCLAIEDSPTGARSAVAAGMTCYAVPDRSHTTPEKFTDITPYIFASLHDVRALLGKQEAAS